MNEKFYSLPEEKQRSILNAAMEVFAKNEYKRASTDLIAAKAGISKGLLFYYFHNKKELYLFLYDYLIEVMKEQVIDSKFGDITDFFELLNYSASMKMKILKKNPYIMDFAMRAFYSEKEEVSEQLKVVNLMQEDQLYQMYFSGIDTYKFKDGVDPYHVYKMLRWMADGYMHDVQMTGSQVSLEELRSEFCMWTGMMRKLVYKEEYQDERD
ncbi:MAG: TetR/AcrR family transcriptional regulator [Faecalicatena sp.]|uniref:TetR/AcrR family transcriptional regulator n=1 Tax=Faecalicatena sp. TaxID=2005360 RepID=UPI0025888753|nr:TetR/AcrR family transcriptional regulator [Faecalicatena sp.]MCI6464987.1 TetR/AcrR family transcriptional regulator [Faecalicatena sp.]MDY5617182.1 TetR/AcrR family transcriptional regulator [Lachnospiraceae bacterium]